MPRAQGIIAPRPPRLHPSIRAVAPHLAGVARQADVDGAVGEALGGGEQDARRRAQLALGNQRVAAEDVKSEQQQSPGNSSSAGNSERSYGVPEVPAASACPPTTPLPPHLLAKPLGDLVAEGGAHGAVHVLHRHLHVPGGKGGGAVALRSVHGGVALRQETRSGGIGRVDSGWPALLFATTATNGSETYSFTRPSAAVPHAPEGRRRPTHTGSGSWPLSTSAGRQWGMRCTSRPVMRPWSWGDQGGSGGAGHGGTMGGGRGDTGV